MTTLQGKGIFVYRDWNGIVAYRLSSTARGFSGTLVGMHPMAALSHTGSAIGELTLEDGRRIDLFVGRTVNETAHVQQSGEIRPAV